MKSHQLAAQLYSFREHLKTPADLRKTLGRLFAIGYRSVQLSTCLPAMPETELRAILEGEGFRAPTAHESGAAILSETPRVLERLCALGCPHVAYPFPHRPMTTIESVRLLASELEGAAKALAAGGVALAYHNHDIEFARVEGLLLLEVLYEEAPALQAELDTYWVHAGGASPLQWISRMGGRMEVIHLKDYGMASAEKCGSRAMFPVGRGNLDWKTLLPAAEAAGVKTFVVEHDGDCPDPFSSFQESFEFLQTHFVI
ncbi:MAG: sugar phosphate isomerase/epimerase [Spirochaetes bacterium]|nr:sugar phosphate isomerase/epimerase [Spirochaetota bacterium]